MYLFNGHKNIQNLSQPVVVIFFFIENCFYFSFQILNINVNICDYSLSLHVLLVSFPSFIMYFKSSSISLLFCKKPDFVFVFLLYWVFYFIFVIFFLVFLLALVIFQLQFFPFLTLI